MVQKTVHTTIGKIYNLLACYLINKLIKPNNYHYRLHRQYNKDNGNKKRFGFTLIEVLIVILVIGIISGTAIGSYSNVVRDAQARSVIDRVQAFFQSCKTRAKLRKTDVKIIYIEQIKSFKNPDSANSVLKVPELHSESIPKQIDINSKGEFEIMGKKANKLDLLFITPSGNLATITIEL